MTHRLVAIALALAATLAAPAVALAHPLGNFTINHHSGLRISAERIVVDQVIDMAEVPAFQERSAIDADRDGRLSEAETTGYRQARCAALATELRLSVGGGPLPLSTTGSAVSFPAGQLQQPTLRLVCEYRATLPARLDRSTRLEFADDSFPRRLGWREIVAVGDGVRLVGHVAMSPSERLTSYPDGLLAQPPQASAVSIDVSPGGAGLPAWRAPELAASSGAGSEPSGAPAPAAVPGGIEELGPELTNVIQSGTLTPPIVLAALAIAVALGALHALTPGHGKTIMAAYLVGTRGGLPQAVGLGLTVAISHTLGVLLLGLVTAAAATLVPAERINPILSLVSGMLVLGIGLWLLAGVLRNVLTRRALARAQHHAHEVGASHAHLDPAEEDGWHSHGGLRHSHVPAEPPAPLRWRGIFALGLAGGLVPSTAALFLLLGSVSLGRPAYGLVLIVAFGLGMAVVMTTIGVALVHARRLLERLPAFRGQRRVASLASAVAAVFVLVAGAWLTTQAIVGIHL